MKLALALITALFMLAGGRFANAEDAGLLNKREPRENLTVGGQPTLEQVRALKSDGYTTVINLRPEDEFDDFDARAEVENQGLNYVHIPVQNIESITRNDVIALRQVLADADGPVLLTCKSGRRASGLLALEAYLFRDFSQEQAVDLAVAAHTPRSAPEVEAWFQAHAND